MAIKGVSRRRERAEHAEGRAGGERAGDGGGRQRSGNRCKSQNPEVINLPLRWNNVSCPSWNHTQTIPAANVLLSFISIYHQHFLYDGKSNLTGNIARIFFVLFINLFTVCFFFLSRA